MNDFWNDESTDTALEDIKYVLIVTGIVIGIVILLTGIVHVASEVIYFGTN